jgi:RimJ/RimL family protein N-acetyltransferase
MEITAAFCKKGLCGQPALVDGQVCRIMSPTIMLRSATMADLQQLPSWFPTLSKLIEWGGPKLHFPLDQPQLTAMLAEGQTTPAGRLLWSGFLPDGELVAHAQSVLDWHKRTARLARIAVSPPRRGARLAAPFLSQVIASLEHETGIRSLELNVYTFNTPAIRLYEQLGFRPADTPSEIVHVEGQEWSVRRYVRLTA